MWDVFNNYTQRIMVEKYVAHSLVSEVDVWNVSGGSEEGKSLIVR